MQIVNRNRQQQKIKCMHRECKGFAEILLTSENMRSCKTHTNNTCITFTTGRTIRHDLSRICEAQS